MNCPHCQTPILREGQKFCTSCGYPLIREPSELETHPSKTVASRMVRKLGALFSSESDDRRSDKVGSPAPPQLSGRRRKTPAPRSLRDVYFELGRALAAGHDYQEAFNAFERARQAGPTSTAEIEYEVARTAEAAEETTRAVRAWLELVRIAPAELAPVIEYLHSRLNSTVAVELREWICKEWAQSINEQNLEASQRADVAVFVGRVHLLLADYQEALVVFTEAIEASPEHATPAVLQHVDQALISEAPGDNYPLAPLQELKGRLLKKIGKTEEAAELLYESGRSFNWRNELPRAVELLRESIRLRPVHLPSYWYLADSLRLLGGKDNSQFDEARRVWDEAAEKIGLPEPEFAWAYTVRALISAQFAEQSLSDPLTGWRLYCEAIALLERGLLLNLKEAYTWAYLAQFLAYVNLEWNAADAARTAVECDKDNIVAIGQLAENLIFIGDFEAAEKVIDDLLARQPEAFGEGLKGYLFLLTERFAEAVQILSSAIGKAPDALWYRELRATSYERLGKTADAQQDWEFLFNSHENQATKLDFSTALAAYKLGRWDQAVDFLRQRREVPIETVGQASRYLGLAEMEAGDWENGPKHLGEGIDQTTFAWRLADFADFDFASFKRAMNHPTERQQGLLEQLDQKIDERISELEREPSGAMPEAISLFEHLRSEGRLETPQGIMIRAILARLHGGKNEWLEAANLYQGLSADSKRRFPEAEREFTQGISNLAKQTAQRLRAGEFEAARKELIEPALALAHKAEFVDKELTARLIAQIAFAHFFESDRTKAREGFVAALEVYRALDATNPGKWLGKQIQELLDTTARYWAVDDFWQGMDEAADLNESFGQELASARKAMAAFLASQLGLVPDAAASRQFYWIVTPLRVEIESSLVPSDTDNWHVLKKDVPAMRKRIQADTGVEVPGVRFRGNDEDLREGTYVISLKEIPIVLGTIERDRTASADGDAASSGARNSSPWMRYCAETPDNVQNIGVPADSLKPATDPMTGAPGCWVASRFWSQVENAGFPLWPEPTDYMMVHVEAVLRRHLAEFVDIQEVARWLASVPEQMVELVKKAMPDTTARLKLTQLLRALVEDGVPILDHALILASLLKTQADQDPLAAASDIRLLLKTQLPGSDFSRIALPADVESKIATGLTGTGTRRCLALTPEQTQDVLAAVRELIPSDKPRLALTVQRTEVRPFVRKLVQLEWPSLAVLAQEELTYDPVNLPQRVAEPPEAVHA